MISNNYLKEVWDKEAASYKIEAEFSPDYIAHFIEMEEVMGNLRGKKILDVGTGTGITSAYLAGKGANLYLVDLSDRALSFARRYFKHKKLNVKTFRQDAFNMNFPARTFDVVWNGGVLEHFEDDRKVLMLKNMWNLVKPGGKLVVTVPSSSDWPFMLAKRILTIRNKWAFGFEDDLTKNRLEKLATRADIGNFEIYAYNPVVSWWFFPYGKEITNLLGINKVAWHRLRLPWGHNLILSAVK